MMNSNANFLPAWKVHMRNIITMLPFYLLFLLVTSLLCYMGDVSYPIVLYPLLFLYCLAAYLIRYYVHKILPYYLLHVLLLVLSLLYVFICPNPIIIGFCLFCAVVMFIYGHNYWISDELPVSICLNPYLVIGGLFAYLFTLRTPHSPYQAHIFVLCVLYILTSNLGNYVVNLGQYEKENANNDSISLAPVLKKNTRIVFLLFAVLFLFAFLANSPSLQAFFSRIINTIGTFFRDILAAIFPEGENVPVLLETSSSPSPMPSGWKSTHPNPFGTMLGTLFDLLVNGLFIVFIIYLFYRLLKYFLSGKRRQSPVVSHLNDNDVQESRTRLTRPKTKPKPTRHKGPEDKIRHQYYKTILNYQKHGYTINETHTPAERANDIDIQYSDDIKSLTKQYEKARYKSPH